MLDGLATAAPLSQSCDECGLPFATVCPRARFCCDDCRQTSWHKVKKRFALVDLFMDALKLAECARVWVQLAVLHAERKCCELATRLGYQYRPKKYQWVKVAK